ncbi:hypothetical protein QR680_015324 [Steinernema hermaphroditum]|uniref:BTB domain-containing protein n=1 Tax=Steinernema hermaphroditum TaxID=289476 RepID=A0AA39H8B6_9BILA|nr:hypothetical protein QR680_015324 [Steinernema hermaphroditum]
MSTKSQVSTCSRSSRRSSRQSSRRRSGNMQYRTPDQNQHFGQVGAYLARQRQVGNQHTMDIEILVDDRKEFLHSVVGCVHSSIIRKMVNSGEYRSPYALNLSGMRSSSVTKVVDWMYLGHIDLPTRHIGDYLAVTARLGVDALHHWLQQRLAKMASKSNDVITCLNIATDNRYKISPQIREQIISALMRKRSLLSEQDVDRLSQTSIVAVLTAPATQAQKIKAANMAVRWITKRMSLFDEVIPKISLPNTSSDLIGKLRHMLGQKEPLRLSTHFMLDSRGKIALSTDTESFKKNVGSIPVPRSSRSRNRSRRSCYRTLSRSRSRSSSVSSDASVTSEDYYRPSQRPSQQVVNARVLSEDEIRELRKVPPVATSTPERVRSGLPANFGRQPAPCSVRSIQHSTKSGNESRRSTRCPVDNEPCQQTPQCATSKCRRLSPQPVGSESRRHSPDQQATAAWKYPLASAVPLQPPNGHSPSSVHSQYVDNMPIPGNQRSQYCMETPRRSSEARSRVSTRDRTDSNVYSMDHEAMNAWFDDYNRCKKLKQPPPPAPSFIFK